MCVYICACMCVCIYVHFVLCVCVTLSAFVYVWVCVCVCILVCVCVYVCVCVCVYWISVFECVWMYICIYVCVLCVRVHVCACVFLCGVYVCVSARRCDCDCVCTLEYVSTHARLYLRVYMSISSLANNARLWTTSSVVRNVDANINDFTFSSAEQRYTASTCIGLVYTQEYSLHEFYAIKKLIKYEQKYFNLPLCKIYWYTL